MGGTTTTTTAQESGLKNPAMDAAATTIGNQLNTQLSRGVTPYTGSMAPNLSSQTQAGVSGLANNPANSAYSGAISNTIGDFGVIASGQRMGMNDPGYATLRAKAADDAATAANATFTNSGRFGGGSHRQGLGEGIGNAIAGMDYANYQNDQQRQMQAAGMLPGLYQGSMLPANAQLQAGQIVDANNLMQAQDAARIFDATNNAGWNTLQRGGAIFSGTAPVSGTTGTTTQSTQQPWWAAPLGIGAGIASFL